MFNRILLVCTGNICRSPTAEALLRARVSKSGLVVRSAGIGALVGHPADPIAVSVAAENGLDLSAHRAQQITQAMLSESDLVLTLDESHGAWVTSRYPQLRGRVHKLGRWRGNQDVSDPYRKPRAAFCEAYELIERFVGDWVPRIA